MVFVDVVEVLVFKTVDGVGCVDRWLCVGWAGEQRVALVGVVRDDKCSGCFTASL